MAKTSNDQGRALEYCLTNTLLAQLPCQPHDAKTRLDQQRDQPRFNALPPATQHYYQQQCQKAAQWIAQNRIQDLTPPLTLRRLNDEEATKGNPTDIEIRSATQSYNISLKHNHHAVKHQRPTSLYQQQAPHFFAFLVGITAFDKIIITSERVDILHFYQITTPTQMQAIPQGNNYILLTFDNDFAFRMRIHTASSRFEYGKTLNLKFDTQLTGQTPIHSSTLQ